MSELNDKLDEMVEAIKTERDELRVRLHLLKAEAKDEWDEVEEGWQHLEGRLKLMREGAVESGEDIGAACRQLTEEIASAYRRMRKTLG